ncbi:hypothetical protein [Pseudomonas sp. F3-2]|uniref:hypothetical protein n=1 Tax=Pseudomonas sp. F3-2 TaxID=3141539 RepID=UPI00315DE408
MTTQNLFEVLEQVEDVTNFQVRESEEMEDIVFYDFAFDFSDIKFVGRQIVSPLFTLNTFNLHFEYVLKKEATKLSILEAVNKYNADRPLLKVALAKYKGRKLELKFSSDFICDDAKIVQGQMEALVKIMAPTPNDFVRYLTQKKIFLTQE